MPLPLLLAASPLPSDAFVPYVPPSVGAAGAPLSSGPVETFDPVGRAQLLAGQLPRLWSGQYRPFAPEAAQAALLRIDSATPIGQMVDLRGVLSIGGVETPVQGNLNAKSDQLDLLLLADTLPAGMEPGGQIMGLQGLSLSGWEPARLTMLGGRLQLQPQAVQARGPVPARGAQPPIRGLW